MEPQKNQPLNKQNTQSAITDADAQEILRINALAADKNKQGSKAFLVFIIAVVVITLTVGIFLESTQKKVSTNSSSSSNPSSQSNPLNSGSVDAQSKYCQNPVNANLYC
jgi:hypothetical protein